jgi:Putative Actinobacterial Holin-X, holin superfamily III
LTEAAVEPPQTGLGDTADAEPVGRQSLPDLFAELVDDGRDWLNAEAAVFRAEARRRLFIAGIGIGLLMLAATLVSGTLVALLVGVMFALTPEVGAGWATAIVVGAALILAMIAAQVGRLQLRKLTRGGQIGEGNPRTRTGD